MSSSDTPGVTPPEPPARGEADAVLFAFRRNVVVAASAGTGKTHRLTALYLLLALGLTSMGQPDERTAAAPLAPERIVATTFSRAAALEISRRVEHALRSFAGWDGVAPIPFADAVIARQARLGAALDPLRDPRSRSLEAAELRRRAAEALGRWGSARIDTLHGVAGQIARAHALALGLPPGARVLEEDEAQALGDLAVDEALGQALEGGGARAEAARGLVAAAGGVAGARAAVTRLLDRLDEEGLSPGELVLADHAAAARTAARELVRVARAAAVGGSEALRAPAASVAAELGTFAAELEAAGEAALPTLPAGAARAIAELFAVRKITGRARTAADEEIAEFIASLPGGKKEARAHHLAAWLAEAPALGARERAMVELLERARSLAAASRRRARALGFGDLLRAARDGLRDRPEVGRAVRHGIDALLVDEFQDTSRVQRDLVYLLRQREDASQARPASGGSATEPRRAGRGAARPEPTAAGLAAHGLFLVGDRKQSIYGFRGADVAVFSRICAELAGRAAGEALRLPEALWSAIPEGAEVADFVALRESRRSGAAILDLVNAFAERDFAPAGAARDFEVAYGPAEQLEPAPAADRGRGEVVVVRDDGATPDGAEPLVRGATGAMREAFVAAAMVAREARAGVAFRDVAVLARRRSTIPLVELALGRLGVPYVVAGRALFDAREVRDVAAALRLLLDPEDRLALATVLRGPMVGLSDAALALLSIPGKGLSVPLGRAAGRDEARAFDARAAALDPADRARLAAFRGRWEDLRRAALRVPPGEAIRIAVAALGYDRVLAALPRPEARLGNVDRLVTIARRRAGGAAATLAGFVRWLDRRIADEADEAEAAVFSPEDDAVRLTTIHASKGLDFPVVVLVDLDAAPRGSVPGIALRPSTGADAAALVIRHVVRHPERPEPLSLTSAALKEARADNLARESAERARLGYVAMTRARDRLVFVGVPGEGKRGSAWRTLAAGLADGLLALHVTRFEEARALLGGPGGPGPRGRGGGGGGAAAAARAVDGVRPAAGPGPRGGARRAGARVARRRGRRGASGRGRSGAAPRAHPADRDHAARDLPRVRPALPLPPSPRPGRAGLERPARSLRRSRARERAGRAPRRGRGRSRSARSRARGAPGARDLAARALGRGDHTRRDRGAPGARGPLARGRGDGAHRRGRGALPRGQLRADAARRRGGRAARGGVRAARPARGAGARRGAGRARAPRRHGSLRRARGRRGGRHRLQALTPARRSLAVRFPAPRVRPRGAPRRRARRRPGARRRALSRRRRRADIPGGRRHRRRDRRRRAPALRGRARGARRALRRSARERPLRRGARGELPAPAVRVPARLPPAVNFHGESGVFPGVDRRARWTRGGPGPTPRDSSPTPRLPVKSPFADHSASMRYTVPP